MIDETQKMTQEELDAMIEKIVDHAGWMEEIAERISAFDGCEGGDVFFGDIMQAVDQIYDAVCTLRDDMGIPQI